MIGTALAIGSMLTGIIAQQGAANAQRKAEANLAKRRQELDLEYKHDYNLDFLNTPMAKSSISLLSQKYIENARKVAQGSVISGASDEKTVAAAEEMQKPYVGAISNLAGYGQQRQDSIRSSWLSSDQHLADLQYGNDLQKAQNWSNFGNNAAQAGMAFAQVEGMGALKGTDDWLKNLMKPGWSPAAGGSFAKGVSAMK
jgi:hypothetical protein